MATFYQLVELTSGNVADDFESLAEAVDSVSRAVDEHGRDAMRTYSLLEVVDEASTLVAMEDDLLALVARAVARASTATADSVESVLVASAPPT